jgi:undecaprenyl-diphosphatase
VLTAEGSVLGGFLAIAALALLFWKIADEVLEGGTARLDDAVLLWFREPGQPNQLWGPPQFEELVRDLTSLGSFGCLFLLVAAVAIYLVLDRRPWNALFVSGAVISGAIISTWLKGVFDRQRPGLEHVEVFTASFPSGHAMLTAVTYLTVGALLARTAETRQLKLFFIGLALFVTLLVGVTRLYLGVHYLTDVLGGWCLGAAWALLCDMIQRLTLGRFRRNEPGPASSPPA